MRSEFPISIALSGGGHRATLFSLGVLMYLADAGKNSEVGSIASVSGGSLTNGFVAQCGNFRSYNGSSFEQEVARPLARAIATKGTLFAPLRTKLYLALVVVTIPALFVPLVIEVWPLALRLASVTILAALWARFLLGARGHICALAFRDTLFSPGGHATGLADITKEVDHVFCATDLRAAEAVYFSGRFVYSYRIGIGGPGDLPLHDAVHASACFPGGFPPKVLPTGRHGFTGAPPGKGPPRPPRDLVLIDGGVYDNMAEQWAVGFAARAKRLGEAGGQLHSPGELLVVNAASGNQWLRFPGRWIPLWAEFASLLQVISVLYENTTTTRRQRLVDWFDTAARTRAGMTGGLIQIAQSPFKVASFFEDADGAWPDRARRSRIVLQALGREHQREWEARAEQCSKVGTVLSALGPETSSRILHHGYVLAMSNLHVLLGYPLLDMPSPGRFEGLCRRTPA